MKKRSRYCIVIAMAVVATRSMVAQQSVAVDMSSAAPVLQAAKALLSRVVSIRIDSQSLLQAIATVSAEARVQIDYRPDVIARYCAPVSLSVTHLPLGKALEELLVGTKLVVTPLPEGRLAISEWVDPRPGPHTGGIAGTVIDATTRQPVAGVLITVDDATQGVSTKTDGRFSVPNVSAGTHRIAARLIGHHRKVIDVVVVDGETTTVSVALESGVNTLDQVVVTGTVIPTELKAVPNAMTVITAKDIEQRGITQIDQLFRGDIPGLFAQNIVGFLGEVTMFSRGVTALSGSSAGVSATFLTNPIKTYIDGVELADAKYLSQIDPKSIERIEILTGPQASTIYGSNAINGVMQIFTKRGTTSRPELTLSLLSGWVENNFSRARTPQHDYSAQLSGVEGRLSYNAGGSWNYMGRWTPAKQTARTDIFGGTRLDMPTMLGRVTADATLRRGITRNQQHGDSEQGVTAYGEDGWYLNYGASGLYQRTTHTLTGQTLGVTLAYVPASWWSQEFGLGVDASDAETRTAARGYLDISDTTLSLTQIHTDRRSLRYATTARIPVTSLAQATVTAGADAWENITSSLVILPQTLTGTLTGFTSVRRQPGHNTGGFLQTQLGLGDQLFLTYGLRAEWNPNYGAEAQPNYAPRYGVAYTQELGPLTAKVRGSYGRSTRPPGVGLKTAKMGAEYWGSAWSFISPFMLPYYGRDFDFSLANPALAPEYQQGGEGGLELYLGTRGSLVVTRYNQTVDGLIAAPAVDSVRTIVPCTGTCFFRSSIDTQGYGYWRQVKNLNVGSIRNQGWELQGSANLGPLTTKGTYSWTKSRTIGVNPKYRAYFANQPQYQPGATFQYLPEHTWALGVTYARASSSVGLNVTGTGRATVQTDDFYFRNLDSRIRLPLNRFNVSSGSYISFNPAYALADLTASHRFSSRGESVLQVQNLTDRYRYTNDYSASYASLGRQLKLGARVRTR